MGHVQAPARASDQATTPTTAPEFIGESRALSEELGAVMDGKDLPVAVTAIMLLTLNLIKQGMDFDHFVGLVKLHPFYREHLRKLGKAKH